jgi:hypothetical protein
MKKTVLTTASLLAALLVLHGAAMAQDDTGMDAFEALAQESTGQFSEVESDESSEDTFTEDGELVFDETGVAPISIDLSDTGRAIRIDATSVEDLQRLLNLPASGQLREFEEDPSRPRTLFSTDAEVTRILGERPEFIYFPEGVDPMIIPWVRERIASEEMWAEANLARANGDFDRAINLLRDLRERFPATDSGSRAPGEIERVIRLREEANRPQITRSPGLDLPLIAPPVVEEPVLPEWVKRNTTGVMMSSRSTVLVGNDFLTEGDPVPRFASVRVKAISASEVTFVYQEKEFVVEVLGNF